MPGYEVSFTSPLDKAFECPVCLIALREPVQVTPCGHRVCSTCLQPILRNRNPRCPLDNLVLDVSKIFLDNACHRQVLSLDVVCSNHEKSCTWVGPLQELKRHLDECGCAVVKCPKDCGVSLERRKIEEHFNECANRLAACEHCGHKVLFADMNLHLQSCASFPVSCPMKCGATKLSKEMLAAHINSECPLLVVPCKFADAGCTFKMERQKMKDHYTRDMENHLNMLCNLVCTQRKQLEAQKESIQLQREHIQLQKEALTLQGQELIDVRGHAANGEFIWRISDFTRKLMDAKAGRVPEPMISEPFYTHPHGYKVCAGLWLNGIGTGRGKYISVGLQVQVGDYDAVLKWPIYPRYTFTLLDQRSDCKDRKDIVATFEPQGIGRPSVDKQVGKGARRFVLQENVSGGSYCKENTVFFKFSVALKQAPSSLFRV